MKIVVAGASGYIGRSLIPILLDQYPDATIYALSRSEVDYQSHRVVWQPCDLFSIKSIEQAAPARIDTAIYLVHSMGPTAALDQGSFADYDLILADNFARVLKQRQCKHMIYLGGIIPEQGELSLHLESRQEVENVFIEHNLPRTIFRAGLIIGSDGSSFQIMLKLVRRLPIMICPRWTQNLMSPVALKDVVDAIAQSMLDDQCINETFDLASCAPLSYLEMMKLTAKFLNKKKLFILFPYFSLRLSRLWVSLITQSSKNLVYPLIESLKHPMLARKNKLFKKYKDENTYLDLLNHLDLNVKKENISLRYVPQRKTVRSVQRLPLPKRKNSDWLTQEYFSWLGHALKPWIKVNIKNNEYSLHLKPLNLILMRMRFSHERSSEQRQLLYIKRGILVSKKNRGRLEFRSVLGGECVLAAIHDYRPALPWFIYRFTQAKVHAWVMHLFAKHLERFSAKP